jgi:hypothetical protein
MVTGADDTWLHVTRAAVSDSVAAMGGRLVSLEVREVHTRPGVESVVGFDAVVEWGTHAPCVELFVVTVDEPTHATNVWRYPDDAVLTGLAAAVDPLVVGERLAVSDMRLEVVSLRPCRRAVVHARGGGVDVHLKVVPPASTKFIADRHVALAAAGVAVPDVVTTDVALGWVVLSTVPGRTLDECLETPDTPCPTAEEVWLLVESIARARLEPAAEVPSAVFHATRHATVISTALPTLAQRVDRVLATLTSRPTLMWRGSVHGDLHPGQLVVDTGGRLAGVLDVDGSGTGDVLDDVGRMIAHVVVAAALGRADVSRRWRFAAELVDVGCSRTDDEQLSHRMAASVLAHASGPWRAQSDAWPTDIERLVALAEQVLDVGVAATVRSRRSP